MKELNTIQTSKLVSLLAEETINYYKLVGYGASIEECRQCNHGIKQIEIELNSRRNSENILHPEVMNEPAEFTL